MTLEEIAHQLGLNVRTSAAKLPSAVDGAYVSDLLSDVMAHAQPGDLWVTLQTHQNVVAVALVKELVGIVMVNGREPDEDTLVKAEKEGVPLLTTDLSTFEVAGRLHRMGLSRFPGL